MFEIESNVPFPANARKTKYPWAEMKVGDSFFVPVTDDAETRTTAQSLRSASRHFAHRHNNGHVFKTCHVAGGLRTWRVA